MKLYADEAGHGPIRTLELIVVSCLARVEVVAALWRKERSGELDGGDIRVLESAFEADYYGTEDEPPRFVVMTLPDSLLDEAARVAATHGLRAYDAVHLASAMAAREADEGCDTFACFDDRLRDAAAAEGFELLPA